MKIRDPKNPREAERSRQRRLKLKSERSTQKRWEKETVRSFERAQTFLALQRADVLERERRLRATKCGADIWPLRPPVGRYEEMW